jgi:hypothetical protein
MGPICKGQEIQEEILDKKQIGLGACIAMKSF